MRSEPYLDRPTIPNAYLALLIEILAERNVDSSRLVEGLSLRPAILRETDARMTGREWGRLALRALELTRDPGLGYEFGLRMRPTVHGLLGFAAMSSASMRDAVDVCIRYVRMRQAHFELELDASAEPHRWILRERFPIPIPPLRRFFIENILLGMARGAAMLLGSELEALDDLEIWFDSDEPPHYAAWRDRLPRVRHARPTNAVVFPSHYLEKRPALADPHASRQAIELCERELALASSEDDDVVESVRRALDDVGSNGYPQVESIAHSLGLSSRTLKRRLERSGTSYLVLLEAARREQASYRLRETSMSVRDIATALGYENPANFSRAFQRWTGESPSSYRSRTRESR